MTSGQLFNFYKLQYSLRYAQIACPYTWLKMFFLWLYYIFPQFGTYVIFGREQIILRHLKCRKVVQIIEKSSKNNTDLDLRKWKLLSKMVSSCTFYPDVSNIPSLTYNQTNSVTIEERYNIFSIKDIHWIKKDDF